MTLTGGSSFMFTPLLLSTPSNLKQNRDNGGGLNHTMYVQMAGQCGKIAIIMV